ncbi:glutaredoxin family protein [Micromonospora globbae]|uniref:glutaredoxin family protein n=1 Tax=Micromonospora globbae TaxID=1894969 RepID=UPI0034327651
MMVITLLTQADCGLCEHAKTVLASIRRDLPVTVEEVDLDSPEGQTLSDGGWVLFAPGLLIDGQPFSYGRLSERRLRRALARTTASIKE